MATLSVVIPTHNRLPVLQQALRCLSEGSVRPDEVVVVDDGSEDPVEAHLSSTDLGYTLRVVRFSPGRGAPSARNAGFEESTGDIVVFMDDDILPDRHMIRYHLEIHEKFPAENYGIMGRIYFDPDLPRTPLMHYLEEEGFFKSVSKAPDRARVIEGLISANFSLKRAYVAGEPLFDENFPYNRNEDTEFGLRMVARGWELRHHTAPSARHHSPLDLDTYYRQIRRGGESKAYWSLMKPDDTQFCLLLGQCTLRKSCEQNITDAIDAYINAFAKEFFEKDIGYCSEAEVEHFMKWVRVTTGWVQDLGQFDGWSERVPAFDLIAEDVRQALEQRKTKARLTNLRSALRHDESFLPAAILLAEDLGAAGHFPEAAEILEPFGTVNWVRLRRGELAYKMNELTTAREHFERAYDHAGQGTRMAWVQRIEASKWLAKLGKTGALDQDWALRAWADLDEQELLKNPDWVWALSGYLSAHESRDSYSGFHEKFSQLHRIRSVEKEYLRPLDEEICYDKKKRENIPLKLARKLAGRLER